MKTIYGILLMTVALVTSSCEKETAGPGQEKTGQLGTYMFDNVEYPVYSISYAADENTMAVVISPSGEDEAKTTYAVIGINSALEGMEIDIERAWHNDDYYFIYEDPVRYYSQYRKLSSGTLYMKRTGNGIDISADLILPDGTDFQFEYSGTVPATL